MNEDARTILGGQKVNGDHDNAYHQVLETKFMDQVIFDFLNNTKVYAILNSSGELIKNAGISRIFGIQHAKFVSAASMSWTLIAEAQHFEPT